MTPSRFIAARPVRVPTGTLAAAAIALSALAGCGSTTTHTVTKSPSAVSTPASVSSSGFTTRVFATGATIQHNTSKGKQSIFQPDDLTKLGSNIYVAFQNGLGPMGETASGNSNSTVVEFSSSGSPLAQWDIAGHADGIATDQAHGRIIVTVNEDGNSSLYVIDPASHTPVQYHYPALPSHGGTDAVSFWHGMMLISASAPGTTGKAPPQASYPAVYAVTLNSSTHTANVRGLFGDEAVAKSANSGATGTTHLALTDPDSNAVVPSSASRFGGDFELTSQGDGEQIFVADSGAKQLSVLKLSQAGGDDSAWPTSASGALYVTDNSADLIYKITGPFKPGTELIAGSPCDANSAPMSCLAKQYLGQVNMTTGTITKIALTPSIKPKGLLFVP
ncbi:MAG TPA: hypothetical protein VFA16_22435 [Mycobacterium sp.]|uniref:hypothetical protein n=1 Tax=Mycobacterium sp. TaxID=1785 RepID=UPI002D2EA265|nr:hypothetical protein [Mycobacterium sp.]HZU49985.1 hypothetical protein [Mycobacterium sp.]